MMILTELLAWVQSPDGVNVVNAVIAALALLGVPGRLCAALALALHLVLML